MMPLNRHTLANGLRILHTEDTSTQMVAVNVLYNVGARDENPEHTGFAHLLEHLMFEGSLHVPDYDTQVQLAGGENNAWTNNDVTNFYLTVPRTNAETAFWLESDRMLGLTLDEKKVEIQKQVVIEEFKQRNLNQPYGDVMHLIRALAYQVHPYQWPTIGKNIEQIAGATLEQVASFYHRHYVPGNAILCVTGNLSFSEVVRLSEKWFGEIPAREVPVRALPQEPQQTVLRRQEVTRDVPMDMLVMAFHMPERKHPDFYTFDVLSDLFANGHSSRLIQRLVHQQKLFSSIDAYIQGSTDAGLFYITGRLMKEVSLPQAEEAVWKEIEELRTTPVGSRELEKVQNRFESERIFNNLNYLNVATNVALFELLDMGYPYEDELTHYRQITAADIQRIAQEQLTESNANILYYRKEKAD